MTHTYIREMGLNCCKEVVDAVFVIPFTAGRLSQLKSGNRKSERKEKVHDGSISGIIILTSILVVTLVVLFGIASFEHPTDKTFAGSSIGSKQIYLSICFLVAAVTCIIFMIVHRLRNSVANALTQDRFFLRIKLSFLWIFTGITVFYSAVKMIKAITCNQNVTTSHQTGCNNSTVVSPETESVTVMYKIVQILFCIVQSTFVHRFMNYNFCVSWKIYYSLLLIFLANISQWTQFFVDVYVMEGEAATPCLADNKTSIDNKCYAATVFEAVRPYCHPIELEYSLLSLLFLAELWPVPVKSKSSNDELISMQDIDSIGPSSISTRDDTSTAPTNSINNEENSNDIELHLLMPENTVDSFSSYPVIYVITGILICAPNFVFGFLSKSENILSIRNMSDSDIPFYFNSSLAELLGFAYDIVITVILIVLLTFCFHALSRISYFNATRSVEIFHFHQNILIISFLGSIAYVSFELLSCVLLMEVFDKSGLNTVNKDAYLLMVKWGIKIYQLYLQVICILQFDNYEKAKCVKGNNFLMMTQSIFLVIATLNFCFWVGDSIFEASSYDNNVMQVVYDRGAEKLITHFLFPFLVFFRFESFICFYGIYRKKAKQ